MSPETSSSLQTTPLIDIHKELKGKLVPFAGWKMPIQFQGVIQEHQCVRDGVGIFDVSHMGEIEIQGPSAKSLVQKLMTNDIDSIKDNQALYTLMCLENGGVVDDLLVHRFSEDHYFLCVNAANTEKDFQWILKSAGSFDVTIRNNSQETSQLALQGKHSEILLQKLCDVPLSEIGYYHFKKAKIHNFTGIIARTGYTGEDGFELVVPSEGVVFVWKELVALGATPCGLGARDVLRLEAGLCLYGHDINETTSPIEANLKWAISKRRREEGGFVGYSKIKLDMNGSLTRLRVGVKPEGKIIAREGVKIFSEENKQIGSITSGTFGPSVNGPIAMGYVKLNFSKLGTKVLLEVRGKKHNATISELPFYKKNYMR